MLSRRVTSLPLMAIDVSCGVYALRLYTDSNEASRKYSDGGPHRALRSPPRIIVANRLSRVVGANPAPRRNHRGIANGMR